MKLNLNNFKLFSALAVCLLCISFAEAQEEKKSIRLLIRSSFGKNFPVNSLSGGYITDNLIAYDDKTFYLQFVSGTYFLSEHWGVELTLSHSVSNALTNRFERFDTALVKKYSDDYYLIGRNYAGVESESNMFKLFTGPVYKVEQGNLVVMGKMLLGIANMNLSRRNVDLKEKNSNDYFNVDFDPEYPFRASFVVNPSLSIGYRFFERLIVGLDINYSVYKPDITYTETTTNQITNETSIQYYRYNNVVQELSLGLGISVVLSQRSSP